MGGQKKDQSLTKDNIRLGFKVTSIWLLNPKVMEERTQMLTIYTETTTKHLCEDGYILGDRNDHVQEDG
jgi:hypothetical protein